MLDAVASTAAEMAADAVERNYLKRLRVENQEANSTAVLRYSPGYCGWHVSGQKKLFEFLQPAEIGITLLESFLMTPLKSISGVLLKTTIPSVVNVRRIPVSRE
jgi:cobalamin-dependent methionine synthase I